MVGTGSPPTVEELCVQAGVSRLCRTSARLPRAMPGSRYRLVQSEWGKANHHDVLIAACSATNACSPGLHAWDCMH